ncbi:MAG: alpha/beta hydrolase [Holophagales bacterium]|nr:alpha/beta hydrolase [Holophagales bacterium]
MPPGWLERLGGGPVEVDGQRLEPILVPLCRKVSRGAQLDALLRSSGEVDAAGAELARRYFATQVRPVVGDPHLMDKVETTAFPGPAGEIPVRIYTPPQLLSARPGLVYFHGGGWVVGDLDTHDGLCRLLASQTPCRVISVGYRLAPEHPFPAAFDDALAAYLHTVERAEELRIDRHRIAVGGDSAGGNLAAAISHHTGGQSTSPCAQLLFYPVLDTRQDTDSYTLFTEGFGLTGSIMEAFFDAYLGPGGHPSDDPRVAPIRAFLHDAGGEARATLPPTLIATAGFDVLRDEGRAYAAHLAQAGVEVVHQQYPSLVHGYAKMTRLTCCRKALDETISELARLFHEAE